MRPTLALHALHMQAKQCDLKDQHYVTVVRQAIVSRLVPKLMRSVADKSMRGLEKMVRETRRAYEDDEDWLWWKERTLDAPPGTKPLPGLTHALLRFFAQEYDAIQILCSLDATVRRELWLELCTRGISLSRVVMHVYYRLLEEGKGSGSDVFRVKKYRKIVAKRLMQSNTPVVQPSPLPSHYLSAHTSSSDSSIHSASSTSSPSIAPTLMASSGMKRKRNDEDSHGGSTTVADVCDKPTHDHDSDAMNVDTNAIEEGASSQDDEDSSDSSSESEGQGLNDDEESSGSSSDSDHEAAMIGVDDSEKENVPRCTRRTASSKMTLRPRHPLESRKEPTDGG
jgi:hypothetical protein